MKTVLITGATGFLGHAIVNELLQNEELMLIAIGGRPEDRAAPLPDNPRLKPYILEDLFIHDFQDIDTVINCAFARSNDVTLLTKALDFTEMLIGRLIKLKVRSVINISSQGVYKRLPAGSMSAEDSPIEPIDLYSLAKYATEKMFHVSTIPYVTNIRMASLMMPQRFLYYFVQMALKRETFTVTAPNQYASLLDISDAASGVAAITELDSRKRSVTYNLGTGKQYSLLQYAEGVKEVGGRLGYSVSFNTVDNSICSCAGMDISRLVQDTGWRPRVFKDEMILKLYRTLGSDI